MQTDTELPLPPGIAPVRRRSWARRILITLAIVGVAYASFFVSLPTYYVQGPGPIRDLETLVEVDDAVTYSSEGALYLTTVSVDTDVTIADFVAASFDPDRIIVRAEDLTGGGSLEDLEREQKAEMRASKQHATEVALAALGLGRPEGDGARVVGTAAGQPAAGVLKEDDVILAVGGNRIATTCDVGRVVDASEVGDEIAVTVRRNKKKRTFQLEAAANPQDPDSAFLGVIMQDVNYRFDPGLKVKFKTGKIAGPSAGLMMSLALYDQLTPDDVTGGRQIAGTGTIACDGGVGAIGGIEQKVAAAENQGAVVFFAPVANAQAAQAAADDIEVVAISTFDDALRYLQGVS